MFIPKNVSINFSSVCDIKKLSTPPKKYRFAGLGGRNFFTGLARTETFKVALRIFIVFPRERFLMISLGVYGDVCCFKIPAHQPN